MEKIFDIMSATLRPTGSTDLEGGSPERDWDESTTEGPEARTWGGDVRGYLENLDGYGEDFEIIENAENAAHTRNLPEGVIFTGPVGSKTASTIWWAAEV